MRHWWRAATAALIVATPAAAVDEPEGSGEAPTPEVAEQLTVLGLPLPATGAAVTVLDRVELERFGRRPVTEALARTPGLAVVGSGSVGGLPSVRIRGGDANFTLVMVDGVPVNDPTDPWGGTFSLATIPTSSIERVEILRGPLSAYHGQAAVSGIINLITRQDTGVEAGVDVGHHELRQAALLAGRRTGRGTLAARAGWHGESGRVGNDAFRQLAVGGSAGLRWERVRWETRARFASWRAEDHPDGSGGPDLGSGALRETDSDSWVLASLLDVDPEGPWRHAVRVGAHRAAADRETPAIPPLVPASSEETRFTRLRVGWTGATSVPGRDVGVRVGASVEREEARNESVLVLFDGPGGEVLGDYRVTRDVAGAFATLTGDAAGTAWEVGLRADLATGHDVELSPRLGLSRSLSRGLALRGAVGRAFKLPSTFALASPRELGGNPDLAAETSWAAEVGLDWRIASGRASGSATAFATRYENLVDFDFDRFLHVNRGRVNVRGVELDARWILPGDISVSAHLTWLDTEAGETEKTLLHRPRWRGGLDVAWELRPLLTLEADLQATSGYADHQVTVSDRDRVAGHALLGLGVRWGLGERWQARVRVDNVADVEAEALIGFPVPGRALRVGLSARLP